MRRTDKEITGRRTIDEIIRGCLVCRLALARGNEPYLVPVSFGYDGGAIYFHTAATGRKIEFFFANPHVCFEFERSVELRRDENIACKWTFGFQSVIGFGVISELVEPAQKEHALNEIMRQYSGKTWNFAEAEAAKIRTWKITVTSVTGKEARPKTEAV